ncbi:MAG TPA: hypothetical protein DCE52_09985 [Rhodobacteraceae bacterium]|nr:hypothetical protein [Paracoccaceae bacterium]
MGRNLDKNFTTNLLNLLNEGKFEQVVNQANKALQRNPKQPDVLNIQGAAYSKTGNLAAAITCFEQLVSCDPTNAVGHNNLGVLLKSSGLIKKAILCYRDAIEKNPKYADAHNNLANTLREIGKLPDALEAHHIAVKLQPQNAHFLYNYSLSLFHNCDYCKVVKYLSKAVAIDPELSIAHFLFGQTKFKLGELLAAAQHFEACIALDKNNAEAFYNLGIVLNKRGLKEAAVSAFLSSLDIKPRSPSAFNNLGNVYMDLGDMDLAVEAFNAAIASDAKHSAALWNLSGTVEDIRDAETYIEKCLAADPNHAKARITLALLNLVKGEYSIFNSLKDTELVNHPMMRSLTWFSGLPELPMLFFTRWKLFDYVATLTRRERPFYEFGVFRGDAFRYLIKIYGKGYGFDTFDGLPEDWHSEQAGSYSSEGQVPNIPGGDFIVGAFEETLPLYFSEKRPMASLINFDADLYSSTICALNNCQMIIDEDTVLVFDEFIVNENWELDEFKALNEFCVMNKCSYVVLAVSFFTKQVAVRLKFS